MQYRISPCHITHCAKIIAVLVLLTAVALPIGRSQTITLTGTIRDFNSNGTTFAGVPGHPDFENAVADDRGIVGPLGSSLGADNKPVYAGGSHSTVNSANSFYQWYHDDSSVNRTGAVTITLSKINATEYQYTSNAFFPIDGQLLGQSSFGHNFGFTTEFHTIFGYAAANNDTFSFTGDDDVFVFINHKLALDLGGVHPPESGAINLNSIAAAYGLVDGNNYTLDVFQAERHTDGSNFTMTTTLQLQSLTPIELWRQTWYGITSNTSNAADTVDPYNTGVWNLDAFAFGGPNQDPAHAAASLFPLAQISGGNLFFSFNQPSGVGGITYGAEWTATLLPNDWHVITDTGSGPQHLFSVPVGSNTKLFIRLRVSDP